MLIKGATSEFKIRIIIMKYVFGLLIILHGSYNVTAQNVSFKFFDAQTGKSIQVEHLVFQNQTKTLLLGNEELQIGKTLNKRIEKGDYTLGILAPGYKAMTDKFTLSKDSQLRRSFYLRNLRPPTNISVDYIRSLHSENGAIIVGYVVDEDGIPVVNATITSNDDEKTITDKEGYFKIFLQITDEQKKYAIKTLEINKPDYKKDIREKVLVYPYGDYIYKITLKKGNGIITSTMSDVIIEDGRIIGRAKDRGKPQFDDSLTPTVSRNMQDCGIPNSVVVGYSDLFDPDTDCVENCPFAITVDFETYVSEVLDNEWLPQWNSLTDIDQAYQAGAVAIRSFASWRVVVNPRNNPNYHMTNNTNDQAYVPGSSSWSVANATATEGIVLKSIYNGNFSSTNYAAETNNWPVNNSNFPCGNGSVINSVFPNQCIADPVTTGHPFNGHGWNMGQWGSARWATGINLDQNYNGNFGPNHNHGKKTWEQILGHYYPSHELCYSTGTTCLPILNIPGNILAGNYEASQSILATGTLDVGVNAMFGSPSIDLLPGFEGVKGSVLDAKFGTCQ